MGPLEMAFSCREGQSSIYRRVRRVGLQLGDILDTKPVLRVNLDAKNSTCSPGESQPLLQAVRARPRRAAFHGRRRMSLSFACSVPACHTRAIWPCTPTQPSLHTVAQAVVPPSPIRPVFTLLPLSWGQQRLSHAVDRVPRRETRGPRRTGCPLVCPPCTTLLCNPTPPPLDTGPHSLSLPFTTFHYLSRPFKTFHDLSPHFTDIPLKSH